MPANPQKLRPIELCRLLNSTLLGEVIKESLLRRHRTQAGHRIGDSKHVDLIRYAAWLVARRHSLKLNQAPTTVPYDLHGAAEGAASLARQKSSQTTPDLRLNPKQERAIAALLTEPTHKAAAAKIGVSPNTLCRWLQLPHFVEALRLAGRELQEAAIGRLEAASGLAVEALVSVARDGSRAADRVRASVAILNHGKPSLVHAEGRHVEAPSEENAPLDSSDVVAFLSDRLRQLENAELSTSEKTRLASPLSKALLDALNQDDLKKRVDALEAVLNQRKQKPA